MIGAHDRTHRRRRRAGRRSASCLLRHPAPRPGVQSVSAAAGPSTGPCGSDRPAAQSRVTALGRARRLCRRARCRRRAFTTSANGDRVARAVALAGGMRAVGRRRGREPGAARAGDGDEIYVPRRGRESRIPRHASAAPRARRRASPPPGGERRRQSRRCSRAGGRARNRARGRRPHRRAARARRQLRVARRAARRRRHDPVSAGAGATVPSRIPSSDTTLSQGVRGGGRALQNASCGPQLPAKETLPSLIRNALAQPRAEVLVERVDGAWTPTSGARPARAHRERRLRDSRCRLERRRPRRARFAQLRRLDRLPISATLFAGCVVVPIYPTQALDHLSYILEHSGARLIFADTLERSNVCATAARRCRESCASIPRGADGFAAFEARGAGDSRGTSRTARCVRGDAACPTISPC